MSCEYCSKSFTPTRRSQRFCGRACRLESYKQEYTCTLCGKAFKSKHPNRKFCSNTCSGIMRSRERRRILQCDYCRKTFERRKSDIKTDALNHFCSPICRNDFFVLNSGERSHRWSSVTVNCSTCGSDLIRQPNELKDRLNHFCDHVCYGTWLSENRSGENSPSWRGNPCSSRGENWYEIAEYVRQRDGYRCQECNAPQRDRRLSVHHIIPFRFFEDSEKANDESNLITLCASCHGKQESHWWDEVPEEYLDLVV